MKMKLEDLNGEAAHGFAGGFEPAFESATGFSRWFQPWTFLEPALAGLVKDLSMPKGERKPAQGRLE